jgi:hypothetical protein
MIFTRYQDFRAGFALVGAPIVADGFPEWPYTEIRAGGFDDGLTIDDPTDVNLFTTELNITCNAFASDAVAGVDDFDWFVSQRTDVVASQYFTVSAYAANKSGSITLTAVIANTATLLPAATELEDYTGDDSLKLLFRDVAVYVQRRSDKAYQWIGANDAVG